MAEGDDSSGTSQASVDTVGNSGPLATSEEPSGLAASDPPSDESDGVAASGESVADRGRTVSTSQAVVQSDSARPDEPASTNSSADRMSDTDVSDAETSAEEGARSVAVEDEVRSITLEDGASPDEVDEADVNRGLLVSASSTSDNRDEASLPGSGLDDSTEVTTPTVRAESDAATEPDALSSVKPKQETTSDSEPISEAPVLGTAPKDEDGTVASATASSEDESSLVNGRRSQDDAPNRLTSVANASEEDVNEGEAAEEESLTKRVATDDEGPAIDESKVVTDSKLQVAKVQIDREEGAETEALSVETSATKERLADGDVKVDEATGQTLRNVSEVEELAVASEGGNNDAIQRAARSKDALVDSEGDMDLTLASDELEPPAEEAGVGRRQQRSPATESDPQLDQLEASPRSETFVRELDDELGTDLAPESVKATRSARLAAESLVETVDDVDPVDGRVTLNESASEESLEQKIVSRGKKLSEPVSQPESEVQVNEASTQRVAEPTKTQSLSSAQPKEASAPSQNNAASVQTGMPGETELGVSSSALVDVDAESERDGDKDSESESESDRRGADRILNRFDAEVASSENAGTVNSASFCGQICPPESQAETNVAAQDSNPRAVERSTNRVEADVPLAKTVSRSVSGQTVVSTQTELFTSNLLTEDSQFDSSDVK